MTSPCSRCGGDGVVMEKLWREGDWSILDRLRPTPEMRFWGSVECRDCGGTGESQPLFSIAQFRTWLSTSRYARWLRWVKEETWKRF